MPPPSSFSIPVPVVPPSLKASPTVVDTTCCSPSYHCESPLKRLALALLVLAALIPVPGAIAGSRPQSGSDLAFFNPASGQWDFGDGSRFYYGVPGDLPLLCDWNGDGIATVGVYRQNRGYLLLHDGNATGTADYEFYYGIPGDHPICGDWNGDGIDTIAIFRPSESKFYLRDSNTQGYGTVEFSFGFAKGIPFSGDWDGDGTDTVGLRDPKNGFVRIARGHSGTNPIEAYFGSSWDTLVVGDWDGDGQDRIGVYRPKTSTLEVSETFSDPKPTASYPIGSARGMPLTGEFNTTGSLAPAAPAPPATTPPVQQPVELPSPPNASAGPATNIPIWDTAWFVPAYATVEEFGEYSAHLQSIGITGTLFQLLPEEDAKLNHKNAYGHQVGTGGGGEDITLTPEFVADLRRMLDAAHAHNVKVGLVVAWAQVYANQGVINTGNGRAYGSHLAAVLGDHPAIEWWIMGGDNHGGNESPEIWAEVTRGLQAGGADQRVGYHNPGGGGRFHTEWWNQLGLMQSGHCGPVDTNLLRGFVNGHNGIAGQGEPPYTGINASWCSYHEIKTDDVVQAMVASIDAGVDFHVYGDIRRAAWGTARWDGDNRGFTAVRDTFGSAEERAVMALVY